MSRFGSNQDACHSFTDFQRTSCRPQCRMISNLLCATHPRLMLSQAWWSLSGSNRRPPACKAGALPAELRPQGNLGIMVGLGGLEPPASPLSGVRSNHLSYRPIKLGPSGQHAWYMRMCRCLVWTSCNRTLRLSFSKGGDPAAPSDTATLLRLHPSHEPLRGRRPPCG